MRRLISLLIFLALVLLFLYQPSEAHTSTSQQPVSLYGRLLSEANAPHAASE